MQNDVILLFLALWPMLGGLISYLIGRKNVLENLDLVAPTIPMNYLSADKEIPPIMIMHGPAVPATVSVARSPAYATPRSLLTTIGFLSGNCVDHRLIMN